MSKIYNVPLVAQTSNNTCWHASSMMIWFYWGGVTNRQGPMNTLSENCNKDLGVTPQQFVALAGKVGLKKVFQQYMNYTSDVLENLLKIYGPLWSACFWYGVGHVIVLTGVDGEKVFFNDPDGGLAKTNTVARFNSKIAKIDGCRMYKDPQAY